MSLNNPSGCVTLSTETSRSLLALVKENDADAWQRLANLYSPLIYYWCRTMQLPEQEMPDIFQEVFHSVAKNIDNFRRDRPGDTFRGWLRTVTQNKVRDFYRRSPREPQGVGGTDAQKWFAQIHFSEVEIGDYGSQQSNEAIQAVYRELYQEALSQIRPHFHEKTWQAFWRVVVDGQSAGEVASELSMQPGTVRVAKSRVLHRLRQEIGDPLD